MTGRRAARHRLADITNAGTDNAAPARDTPPLPGVKLLHSAPAGGGGLPRPPPALRTFALRERAKDTASAASPSFSIDTPSPLGPPPRTAVASPYACPSRLGPGAAACPTLTAAAAAGAAAGLAARRGAGGRGAAACRADDDLRAELARMKAYYDELDASPLAVESPTPKKGAARGGTGLAWALAGAPAAAPVPAPAAALQLQQPPCPQESFASTPCPADDEGGPTGTASPAAFSPASATPWRTVSAVAVSDLLAEAARSTGQDLGGCAGPESSAGSHRAPTPASATAAHDPGMLCPLPSPAVTAQHVEACTPKPEVGETNASPSMVVDPSPAPTASPPDAGFAADAPPAASPPAANPSPARTPTTSSPSISPTPAVPSLAADPSPAVASPAAPSLTPTASPLATAPSPTASPLTPAAVPSPADPLSPPASASLPAATQDGTRTSPFWAAAQQEPSDASDDTSAGPPSPAQLVFGVEPDDDVDHKTPLRQPCPVGGTSPVASPRTAGSSPEALPDAPAPATRAPAYGMSRRVSHAPTGWRAGRSSAWAAVSPVARARPRPSHALPTARHLPTATVRAARPSAATTPRPPAGVAGALARLRLTPSPCSAGPALRRRPPSAVPPDAKHGFNSAGPSSPAPAASSPDALAALLALCGQGGDARAAPGMDELLELHLGKAAMAAVKVGEGTFGEAYRLGDSVVKVVPFDGTGLLNGEPQKAAAELLAEAEIATALTGLRGGPVGWDDDAGDATAGFAALRGVGVCRGAYSPVLASAWRAWQAVHGSENAPVDGFEAGQLYALFVVDDGGTDLEHFDVRTAEEARSVLLQAALALAVAEAVLQFEHRDLHWGNVLVRRPAPGARPPAARLAGADVALPGAAGLEVAVIDYTLSRVAAAGGGVAFCDLDADPGLFAGPRGDCQADTYRRMRKATRGDWSVYTPSTNALWLHYLADVMLTRKRPASSADGLRALRAFRKRALAAGSAGDLLLDPYFEGAWVQRAPRREA